MPTPSGGDSSSAGHEDAPAEASTDLRAITADVISDLGLEREIEQLRSRIDDWIAGASSELRDALRWQFLDKSKHYRPLLVFACYQSMNDRPAPDRVVRSAVAIELFHNMSLIIDDILDRSRHRRGKLTLHCRFGNLKALMTSGYVVADGFAMVSDDAFSIQRLSELTKRLGVAECMQWRLRRQPLGVEDWRRIAGEDTGSMFEVCACLGSRDERLRKHGQLVGLLYHGCDDVGDVRGLEALGGGGEEDLRDGILTLPAAFAIRDPKIAQIFVEQPAGSLGALRRAFVAKLPAAESYLDEIAREATVEAQQFARAPAILEHLVTKVRTLSLH